MTNFERIKNMSPEELAKYIPCPYDTAGIDLMPCILDKTEPGVPDFISPGKCEQCTLEWLRKDCDTNKCFEDIVVNPGAPNKCSNCFGAANNDCRFCGDDGT